MLTKALIARARNSPTANTFFREILSTNEHFHLDPLRYSPSFRADFERRRQELHQTPKQHLTVTANDEWARIFVNGSLVGSGSAALELVSGSYVVEAVSRLGRSLKHRIDLQADVEVTIDILVESGLDPAVPLCVNKWHGEAMLSNAALMQRLGASQLVALSTESGLLSVVVYNSKGESVREASAMLRADVLVSTVRLAREILSPSVAPAATKAPVILRTRTTYPFRGAAIVALSTSAALIISAAAIRLTVWELDHQRYSALPALGTPLYSTEAQNLSARLRDHTFLMAGLLTGSAIAGALGGVFLLLRKTLPVEVAFDCDPLSPTIFVAGQY